MVSAVPTMVLQKNEERSHLFALTPSPAWDGAKLIAADPTAMPDTSCDAFCPQHCHSRSALGLYVTQPISEHLAHFRSYGMKSPEPRRIAKPQPLEAGFLTPWKTMERLLNARLE